MGSTVHHMKMACDELGLPYSELDQDESVLELHFGQENHLIVNTKLGINSDSQALLMKDKYYLYLVLSHVVPMPLTQSFVDPDPTGPFSRFARNPDTDSIIVAITNSFGLPVIVKRNSGTQGKNVFLCTSKDDVETAVRAVYSKQQLEYDHVALAQQYIKPRREFRAIMFNGKAELVYYKDISDARFTGNLSPLHWDNVTARLVTDRGDMASIQRIIDLITTVFPATYAGLDLIEDEDGKLWLIEMNSSPAFGEFTKYIDASVLVEFYKKILIYLETRYGKNKRRAEKNSDAVIVTG